MIVITENVSPFPAFQDYLNYIPKQSFFFDIETTGLSHTSASVFLIGTLHLDTEENWILTQYLCERSDEEAQLLEAFLTFAQNFHTVLHFNGTSFDLPFLADRIKKYQLPNPLNQLQSIDLYQKLRFLKKLYPLNRMNQISLEVLAGWQRSDQLTGKHMISLFQTYTRSNEPRIRTLLLLHNHDDMIGMTKLLTLLSVSILKEGDITSLTVQTDETCTFRFQLRAILPAPLCIKKDLYPGYDILFQAEAYSGMIQLPLLHDELKYFFKDYRNYFYLPLEDQAIHKSIGSFVDKEQRRPAVPATCYTRKSGCFLAQPAPVIEPVFQKNYEEKQSFFLFDEAVVTQPESLLPYVKSLLTFLLT